jgi:aryl-alcohol dehydrogenase-like predicted oxidoreductase
MEYTVLERTGLKVSVAGLGCGGPSRLGLRDNGPEAAAVALVRRAVDRGINFLDTAESYGTEEIVGKAITGIARDHIVISTKRAVPARGDSDPAGDLRSGVEQSLRRLRSEYIDIFHLHGVEPEQYAFGRERLLPELLKLKQEGKIRFIGITEAFNPDPGHQMLERALADECWDAVMVGFNLLNQSARRGVFPKTIAGNVGVLVMFAVRRALSRPERLKQTLNELREKGLVDPVWCGSGKPLEFLLSEGGASSFPDAGYRYCRHEPGVHVVLTGTGSPEHLDANIESILKPPLAEPAVEKLRQIFRLVDCVTGG